MFQKDAKAFSSIFLEHSKDVKTFYQVSNEAKKKYLLFVIKIIKIQSKS